MLDRLARNSDLKRVKSLILIPNFDKDGFGRRVYFLIALEALAEYLLKLAASIAEQDLSLDRVSNAIGK